VSRVMTGGPCHQGGLHVGDKLISVSSALVNHCIDFIATTSPSGLPYSTVTNKKCK